MSECAFFEEYEEYALEIDYTEYQKLLYEITQAGGKITSTDFSNNVSLCFSSPARIAGRVCAKITAATNGKRTPALVRKYFDEEKLK